MRRLFVLAALVLALPSQAAPTFIPLGLLPYGTLSIATAVSADGSTAVGYSGTSCVPHMPMNCWSKAFRWTRGDGMVDLGPAVGVSDAQDVSANGSVVVGSTSAVEDYAFRWTSEGGMGLGWLPGGFYSSATGVSADGSTVVGSGSTPLGSQAFRWTAADGMVGLGDLPGDSGSYATGVAADGSTVVGFGSGFQAFRWTSAEGMVGLSGLPGWSNSNAEGVSADGSTIVGFGLSGSGQRAFRWTSDDGMMDLGVLAGGNASTANAVSADGSTVVGNSDDPASGLHAFVWDATHGMRDLAEVLTGLGLDLSGWLLDDARDVSADGQTIVGYGRNPSGQTEAWLATIPEPDACLLGTVSVLALAANRILRLASQ